MKLEMFAVRDRATDQYGNPMFLVSAGQANRSFTDEINRSDTTNMMYMHPDDFDLYYLGAFDTTTAQFTTDTPKLMTIGKDVKIRDK